MRNLLLAALLGLVVLASGSPVVAPSSQSPSASLSSPPLAPAVTFWDDFEDGNFDGWHVRNPGARSEWSVTTIRGRQWAHHEYTGSETGHTDTNWLICDCFTVNLSKEFVIVYWSRCDYPSTFFGGGLLSLDEARGPGYLGCLADADNLFVVLNDTARFASGQGIQYRVEVMKVNQDYFGYVNGSLVLTATSPVAGIYEFAFTSRGYAGRACEAALDWVTAFGSGITVTRTTTTTTTPTTTPTTTTAAGIPGFAVQAIVLGTVLAVTATLLRRRQRRRAP